jgi:hypothetical protein
MSAPHCPSQTEMCAKKAIDPLFRYENGTKRNETNQIHHAKSNTSIESDFQRLNNSKATTQSAPRRKTAPNSLPNAHCKCN